MEAGCCKNDAYVVDFQKSCRLKGTVLKGSHTHAHTYQCGKCKGCLKKLEEGRRRVVG